MTANRYQDDQPTRLALLEQSLGEISRSLVRLENKMDDGFKETNEKFNKMDDRFNKFDDRITRLETKVDSNFKWIISTVLITFGGQTLISLLNVTAKLFHLTS